jgi:membrane protease YdiL (CAAX protease family)
MKRANWRAIDILLAYSGMILGQRLLLFLVRDGLLAWAQDQRIKGTEFLYKGTEFLYLCAFLLQCILLLLMVELFIVRRRRTTWAAVGFFPVDKRMFLRYGIGGGFCLTGLMLLSSYLLTRWAPEAEAQGIEAALRLTDHGLIWLGLVVSAGFLAPLYEEIFFRGVVYTWMRGHLPAGAACILNGSVFALLHLDPWRFLPIAAGGAILCYLFEKTRSLYVSIAAHALWNSIMVLAVLASLY